jgi:hypothetical protein
MSKPNSNKIILDLCGGTGAWSRPYKEAGYDVILIDPKHDTGDVRLLEKFDWPIHGVLSAPPCTHLSSSGARWYKAKGIQALKEAMSIVDACLRAVVIYNPVFWCLENPVGRLSRFLGKPLMYFNPCDYGDPWTKKTCLWGRFNQPKKNPVEPVPMSENPIWNMSPSEDRGAKRSITPPGFAKAFFEANQ